MSWRLPPKEYEKNKGAGNKKLFKKLVAKVSPGIIAYHNGAPAGWCAFAPREEYIRLENSRVLKKIDDEKVLAVTCFFIRRNMRKKGLSILLLEEVKKHAKASGFKIIEGYPVTPYMKEMPAPFAWTGLPSTFAKAGFKVAAQRGKRKIMRHYL